MTYSVYARSFRNFEQKISLLRIFVGRRTHYYAAIDSLFNVNLDRERFLGTSLLQHRGNTYLEKEQRHSVCAGVRTAIARRTASSPSTHWRRESFENNFVTVPHIYVLFRLRFQATKRSYHNSKSFSTSKSSKLLIMFMFDLQMRWKNE